jgi:hypothetical protein
MKQAIRRAKNELIKGWKIEIHITPGHVFVNLYHKGKVIGERTDKAQAIGNCVIDLLEQSLDIQKQMDQEAGVSAPEGFDPMDAGERWDDDY